MAWWASSESVGLQQAREAVEHGIGDAGLRPGEEAAGVNKVLDAAALTYVAAFVASLGTLVYYLMMLTGNRGEEH